MLFRQLTTYDLDPLLKVFFELESEPHFRPHPLTLETAGQICAGVGRDLYCGAFDGEPMCAYGMLRWSGFEHPSLGIFVRGTHRGLGLGRQMMKYLHGQAKERSATRIRLRVHPQNKIAMKLYADLGYVFDGEVDREQLVGWYDVP